MTNNVEVVKLTNEINREKAIDIYWGMYQEHQASARHHETQRSTVNNFIIVVTAGILTLIFTGGFSREDEILTAIIILLGLIGLLFNYLLYKRYDKHKRRAYAFRDEIDRLLFSAAAEPKTTPDNENFSLVPRTLQETKDYADFKRKTGFDDKLENFQEEFKKLKEVKASKVKSWWSVHLLWITIPLIMMLVGGAVILLYETGYLPKTDKPLRVIVESSSNASAPHGNR